MATVYEKTDNRCYPSKYSPGKYVTGAQYVIELICERKAALNGEVLSLRFWRNEEWAKEFSSQTRTVNSLLKKYSVKALVHVLHDNPRIYSLRAAWIKPKIDDAQRLVDKAEKRKAEAVSQQKPVKRVTVDVNSKPRQRVVRKNALSKLYELDEV